jgi:hypothetical protein
MDAGDDVTARRLFRALKPAVVLAASAMTATSRSLDLGEGSASH